MTGEIFFPLSAGAAGGSGSCGEQHGISELNGLRGVQSADVSRRERYDGSQASCMYSHVLTVDDAKIGAKMLDGLIRSTFLTLKK